MRLMIIVLFAVLLVAIPAIGTLVYFNLTGQRYRSDKYLDKQYLSMCKKAQKASKKNRAIAEFYMAESERYKMLINERREISQMAKSAMDRALQLQKEPDA